MGKEGSYIDKLIALAKEDGQTFETRAEVLNWAADVDSEKDHPLRGKVEKIYYEMTDPDKDSWLVRQIARKQGKSKEKPDVAKDKPKSDEPVSDDEKEIDEVTGRKIKTKSKVLDDLEDTMEEDRKKTLGKWTKEK